MRAIRGNYSALLSRKYMNLYTESLAFRASATRCEVLLLLDVAFHQIKHVRLNEIQIVSVSLMIVSKFTFKLYIGLTR